MWFIRIKKFYDQKLWTRNMVADGVVAGKITPEEYEQITGEAWCCCSTGFLLFAES